MSSSNPSLSSDSNVKSDKQRKSVKIQSDKSNVAHPNVSNSYLGKYDIEGYINPDGEAPIKTAHKHRREVRKR